MADSGRRPWERPVKVIAAGLADLQRRARTDFRGHVPAPEPLKTKDMIEKAKKVRESQMVDPKPFKPGAARTDKKFDPLGFTATKPGKRVDSSRLQYEDHQQPPSPPRPSRNGYNQELDPDTQRPMMASVLAWKYGEQGSAPPAEQHKSGLKIFRQRYETSDDQQGDFFDAHNVRAVRQDLEALTPRHRTALIRQIAMANPKFTAETRARRRSEHWDPMSQVPPAPLMPSVADLHAGRRSGSTGRRLVVHHIAGNAAYRRRAASSDAHRPWR